MIFKQLAMAAILFFRFGEDIFIHEWDIKVYVKPWQRTDAQTEDILQSSDHGLRPLAEDKDHNYTAA